MTPFTRVVPFGLIALLLLLAGCRGDDDAAPARGIAFHAAEMVRPPAVLTGDPSDGRCAGDGTAPCFKDKADILNGQRRMLRIEDLGIAARTRVDDGAQRAFTGGIVRTADSAVGAAVPSSLAGSGAVNVVSAPAVIGARLFDGDRDVLVTAVVRDVLSVVIDRGDGSPITGITGQGVPAGISQEPELTAAKGDFTGDGLDEVVFATFSNARPTLQVMAATDPADPGRKVRFGPAITVKPMLAMAVGNFFGGGNVVVIAVAQPDGTLLLQYFAVDPKTLALSLSKAVKLDRPAGALPVVNASLAPGRYLSVDYEQLLVAASDGVRVDLLSVDADTGGAPVQRLQAVSTHQIGLRAVLRAGRFDGSSPFDSVAYMLTDLGNRFDSQVGRVLMLSLDANLDVASQSPSVVLDLNQCVYDMQVGNFDRRDPDPTPNAPPGATVHNPGLQLAFVTSSAITDFFGDHRCGSGDGSGRNGLTVAIWNVVVNPNPTPATSPFTLVNDVSTFTWGSFAPGTDLDRVALAPVDLQGRSLVLGPPLVLVQPSNRQVNLVLAAPPMHADFIGPDGALLNLTVAPKGFNASFTFASDSDASSTSTATTSSTFATGQTVDAKLMYGECVGPTPLACGSIEDKASLKEASATATSALDGTFSATPQQFTDAAVFHDQVLWSDSVLTMYVYPVLGRKACPQGKPGCQEADKLPLTVTFSGPDSVQTNVQDGGSIDWYQPPWMPGNVLSYPGNRAQLERAAYPQLPTGALQELSADTVTWFTDEGNVSQQSQWRNGAAAGSTVSHSGSFSYDNTTSIGLTVTPPLGLGFSASISASEAGSSAWANLTDSRKTLSQTRGVTFTKGAQFAAPTTYQYGVRPMIFGRFAPPQADASPAPAADAISTWGALRTGYVVDPLGDTAGSMWRSGAPDNPYRRAPDVAFNHPDRWIHCATGDKRKDGPCPFVEGACLFVPSALIYECVKLTARREPEPPISDDYHRMRGFFILGAEGGGQGGQLASAVEGDKLLLQARVHNFSLREMPAGSSVRVRFHGMKIDTATNAQAAGTASFLIGEAAAPPIPAFSTTGGDPNWALVGQTFDTTGYAGANLLFWAVTWIDDGSGRMVAELPDKGLTALPPAGPTAAYADIARLDEKYGNNVGIYPQVFQVLPRPAGLSVAAPKPATAPSLVITEVGSDAASVANGERALVAARLRVGENTLDRGVTVHFIDGEPGRGGRLIAARTLQRLEAGTVHEFRAAFRSKVCGAHPIHVVAGPGTRFEHVARLGTIDVTCN